MSERGETMVANVESMAYAGKVPWHGLGEKVGNDLTPIQMARNAGLEWNVEKKPFINPVTGKPSTEWFVLVRDTDGQELSPCGRSYVPTQNEEALNFFQKFVKSGNMTMETAGSLDGGRVIWGLAKTSQSFELPGRDEVKSYLLLVSPHIWGKSLKIMWSGIRVVCQNTLMMALGAASEQFSAPHIREFDASVQQKAEEALGLADVRMEEFKEQATLLSGTRYKEEDLYKFWMLLFQPSLKNEATLTPEMFGRTLKTLSELHYSQPGANMSEGTWWQALNGVTYYLDHEAGRDRDASLTSAWLGQRAATKRRALSSAVEFAKAA